MHLHDASVTRTTTTSDGGLAAQNGERHETRRICNPKPPTRRSGRPRATAGMDFTSVERAITRRWEINRRAFANVRPHVVRPPRFFPPASHRDCAIKGTSSFEKQTKTMLVERPRPSRDGREAEGADSAGKFLERVKTRWRRSDRFRSRSRRRTLLVKQWLECCSKKKSTNY